MEPVGPVGNFDFLLEPILKSTSITLVPVVPTCSTPFPVSVNETTTASTIDDDTCCSIYCWDISWSQVDKVSSGFALVYFSNNKLPFLEEKAHINQRHHWMRCCCKFRMAGDPSQSGVFRFKWVKSSFLDWFCPMKGRQVSVSVKLSNCIYAFFANWILIS